MGKDIKTLSGVDHYKEYRKDYIYDQYYKIMYNYVEYDKISRSKMIKDIYKEYNSHFEVLYSLLSYREFIYLKKIFDNDKEYLKDKYKWENGTLKNKFILVEDYEDNNIIIASEIYDTLRNVVKSVTLKASEATSNFIDVMVGIVKTLGEIPKNILVGLVKSISSLDDKLVNQLIDNSLMFNYYVGNYDDNLCYIDYEEYFDDLRSFRRLDGKSNSKVIDINSYKEIFYNDFDISNSKIKLLMDTLKKYGIDDGFIINEIDIVRLLNSDRSNLIRRILCFFNTEDIDIEEIINIINDAMDEMYSGALVGVSPNEYKLMLKEDVEFKKSAGKFKGQKNAHLSKNDADLFYKIYFSLLDFTNQKYKVVPNLKIYNQTNLDPAVIKGVIDVFWNNNKSIIFEYRLSNKYGLSKEELEIVQNFSKGIRDVMLLVKYENDYAIFLINDKFYMVKGIRCNIDRIINNEKLPLYVETSVVYFKDSLIFDGIITERSIDIPSDLKKDLMNECDKTIKHYQL